MADLIEPPIRRKGEKITVYYDPLSENEPEAEARIVRWHHSGGWYEGRKINWYEVKFSDGAKATRKILEPLVLPKEKAEG